MAVEIPFEYAERASEILGRAFAIHVALKGASLKSYTEVDEHFLTTLFREKVQKAWEEKNGRPLTPGQLDSLEESFSRNFGVTLGSLSPR